MPFENLKQDPTKPGFIDLYAFFKISKQANDKEIDRAFRKMSMAWHPDKNRNNPEAATMFTKLSAWRDLLKDSHRRAEYDSALVKFNEERDRISRSSRPYPRPREPSSLDSSHRSEIPRSRSGQSSYGPPPRYESRGPSDYDTNHSGREPTRHASSRPRTRPEFESSEFSPLFGQPQSQQRRHEDGRSDPSRPFRHETRVPRYETRAPDDYRSPRFESQLSRDCGCECPDCQPPRTRSSRSREKSCDCSDYQPYSRTSGRHIEYVILVDDDDVDYYDRPRYEYESRYPFDREPRNPRNYDEPRSSSSACRPSGYDPREYSTRSGYDCC